MDTTLAGVVQATFVRRYKTTEIRKKNELISSEMSVYDRSILTLTSHAPLSKTTLNSTLIHVS